MKKNKNILKDLVPYLMLLVIVSVIYYVFNMNNVKVNDINYNEFITNLKAEKVKELEITPKNSESVYYISGKLDGYSKNESFKLIVPFTDSVIDNILDISNEQQLDVKINKDSGSISWIAIIFDFVPIILITGLSIYLVKAMMGNGKGGALDFGRSRAKLNQEGGKVTFKDVAGLNEEKEEVKELIDFLKNPKKFQKLGARIPKGVLLVGPPGTGKTLLAKAVAGEAKVPFYYISGSDFVELFVGVGASRVRDMFKQAKQSAPCLIFIDEIDAVGRQRGTGLGGGHDEREQTLNQLLTEMDGFGANEGIIIIAATNRPDVLDPALLRPGRFDRQVTVNLPDVREREAILNVHAKGKTFEEGVNLKRIAERTPGYSGADLENLLNESALLAVRRNKDAIGMDEIDEASDRVLMGPAKVSRKVTDYEKNIVAYHESGHAVLGIELPNGEEVHKITIIPRGMAGGYTQMLPKEERTLVATKDELLQRITSYLGGRVAEELFCGEISTGASDDFKRATQIARSMVTEYGMSDLGPVQFEHKSGEVFLGRDYTNSNKNYSDTVALEIDKEIRKIINECYKNAKDILSKNKGLVEALAKTLYEKETITKEEIEEVVREYNEGKKTKNKDKVEE